MPLWDASIKIARQHRNRVAACVSVLKKGGGLTHDKARACRGTFKIPVLGGQGIWMACRAGTELLTLRLSSWARSCTLRALRVRQAARQGMLMSQNGLQLDLQKIPAQVRPALEEYAKRVQATLKDNLYGITVVGSCLTADFRPGVSDVNTLLVVREQHQGVLMGMAGLVKGLRKERFSLPWVMTLDYVDRSRRVFGIEWLEFQWLHQTILGPDPLGGLTFGKPDVRLQCERELKAALVRLRQGYIAAAGDRTSVRDLVIAAAKSLMPTLRAMLWLVDLDRKPGRAPTCQDAWEAFGIDTQILASVLGWHYQDLRPSAEDVQSAFDAVYATVDQLAYFADDLEV
jgi:hypothetical protein